MDGAVPGVWFKRNWVIAVLLVLMLILLGAYVRYYGTVEGREVMIKALYAVFLAIMIALFVGLGVQTFYPQPKAPEYPQVLETKYNTSEPTAEQKAADEQFREDQEEYFERQKTYSLRASIIITIASIALLVLSLTMLHQLALISDGVLLGGVLTLLYGIIRGFMSENDKYRFLVVTLGLIVAIVLGYIRFIKPEKGKYS